MMKGMAYIDGTVSLNGIAYAAGIHEVQYQDNASSLASTVRIKGLVCVSGAATVVVHPVRNRTGQNIPVALEEGVPVGVYADYIVEAGTTAPLTHVYAIVE